MRGGASGRSFITCLSFSIPRSEEEGDIDPAVAELFFELEAIREMQEVAVEDHHPICLVRHGHIGPPGCPKKRVCVPSFSHLVVYASA